MSFSNVVLFSNYITNSVINDKKTDFQMVDGIDMSSIIAKSTYDIPLLEFILGIFKSTIINMMEYAILQIFNYDLMVVISYEKALAIYKTISTKM